MKRIPSLDGWRAVAVVMVVYLHAQKDGMTPFSTVFPYCGRVGVALFFVLSGYLITSLLLRDDNLPRFYLRRALRIFPPFYAFLAFLVALDWFGVLRTSHTGMLLAGCYCLNLTRNYRDHNIEHTWSLCFEEQYYLVWPLLLRWMGPGRARWAALAVPILWPVARLIRHAHDLNRDVVLQSTGFDTLAIGSALALWAPPRPLTEGHSRGKWAGGSLGVLASWAVIVAIYSGYLRLPVVLIPPVRDSLLAFVVWSTANRSDSYLGRLLDSRALVYVGTLSYSLYLWHRPFLQRGAEWPVCLVTIVGFAHLSYFGIERPLQKWRARLRGVRKQP